MASNHKWILLWPTKKSVEKREAETRSVNRVIPAEFAAFSDTASHNEGTRTT